MNTIHQKQLKVNRKTIKMHPTHLLDCHKEDTACQERNEPPNKKMSKTTDTTPPLEKTTRPQASPHKAKSKKHRSRNTPTIHTCPLTSDPTQVETQTNSPNCYKSHNSEHSMPKKRKLSPMPFNTTVPGSNGQANRRRNPSPSIPLRCISTNA